MKAHAEIIAGFDGSELSREAVRTACALAEPDTVVTVLHAYEVRSEIAYYPFFADFQLACEKVAKETIESARDCAGGCPGEVRFETVVGRPAEALARAARERGAALIVVGSRGVGPLRAVLGSVTHRLLHDAPCPVLVIPDRGIDAVAAADHAAQTAAGSA